MLNALKKTLRGFFSKNKTIKNKSKNKTIKNKNKKSKMNGGKYRVYYGEVNDSSGKTFTNINFSKGNARGLNAYWQDINELLEKHVSKTFDKSEIVSSGFGGDDSSGVVVVNSMKSLPPMSFTIDNKNYIMNFNRSENRND